MYHPNLGRFIQRDPLEYADGMNLYEYTRGNPLMHADPNGERASRIGGGRGNIPRPPLPERPKPRLRRHRAWYGNYCGVPIWPGAQQPDSGSLEIENPLAPDPIDDLDMACQFHDQCWEQVHRDAERLGMQVPRGLRAYRCPTPAHLRCDDALCDLLRRVACDNLECRIFRRLAMAAFCNRREGQRLLCPECPGDTGTDPTPHIPAM